MVVLPNDRSKCSLRSLAFFSYRFAQAVPGVRITTMRLAQSMLPKDRRIDLLGVPHELALPLKLVSPITAYLLDGRWLFPAYDMALILRYAAPSVVGGQCPHKEMWKIQVDRHILPNGLMSHQVLGKNFIPLEDVLDLVARSKAPEKDEIASYIESLREQEEKE